MTTGLRSYSKIYALGHRAIRDLFDGPVVVEEKVDGSQFSFGLDADGELHCRSKGKELDLDAPEKMFTKAVEMARKVAPFLDRCETVRCEYLQKPKHNTLAYDRVPRGHLIVFDIDIGMEEYYGYALKRQRADQLGLECVPFIESGVVSNFTDLKALLDRQSILGGQKIEGIVVKNYAKFDDMGKTMMGKWVSEEFKEIHRSDWKDRNPGKKDIIQEIGESLRTPARWNKAVQHLREAGQITDSPQDIGALMKELNRDILEDCKPDIMEALFKKFWKDMSRIAARGFPEWYKEQLAESQFCGVAQAGRAPDS